MVKKIKTQLDGYITSSEAARVLGLEERAGYIRKLCSAGRFPGAVQLGRMWIIPVADWNTYLEERKQKERQAVEA